MTTRADSTGKGKKVRTESPAHHAKEHAEEKLMTQVNRELYKRNAELAVRNKTLALLRRLDEISMTLLGMNDMTYEMATAIATELGFDLVSIALVDDENKRLRWVGYASPVATVTAILKGFPPSALTIPLAEKKHSGIQVLRRTSPVAVENIQGVFPTPLARVLKSKASLTSSLIYPLRMGRRPLGILTVSASRNLSDLSSYEREALTGLLGLVSIGLEKARIYQELQETSADLRLANTQLAQLDKAKSEFLSIASHQLYTPLTAIRGYLSMLQDGDFGDVPEKQRGIVDILRASSDRLIDLIRNLLDVSRIESGRLELSLVSVDILAMAKELVTELKPNAERKDLLLQFQEPTSPMPKVVADTQRLRQVLLNTVDNAIKYTDTGKVTVSVRTVGPDILFTIADTGKGMSAEDLKRIFAKFVRVGGADRYHTEGSGLGMYVARQIVREHRGDIWAESPGAGKGSTFYVKLPVEGSKESLKAGEKVTVGIKAANVGETPEEAAKK